MKKKYRPSRSLKSAKVKKASINTQNSYYLRDIPDEMYRSFKARCAMEAISIRGCIIDLMTAYAAGRNK